MKLSSKFFCIAYIVVLLSTGLGGMFIIKSITDTIRDTRIDQVNAAANYAADSFLAFADVSYGDISGSRKSDITRQIKNSLDSSVTDVQIYTADTAKADYTQLSDNEGFWKFISVNDHLVMESVCRLNTGSDIFYLAVRSDFTETEAQCNRFWNSYAIVVFAISATSGLLLFALTKRVTKSLYQLTTVTDDIALGNYGKKVELKSSDREIIALSESFNAMSSAIEQKINEIKEETQKRDIFVADFTHELKTPMTAIIGYSQLLDSYDLDATERKQAASAICSEAKRLEKLSLQLLNLYVYKNEETEFEELPLPSVEEQLLSTLKYLSEKYGVPFSVELGEDTVTANGVLLLSLLYNLADNAFKASDPSVTVRIYSRPMPDSVRIFVEDRGKGIAVENIKLLTEPFYREDKSRSRKLGGAGLGLSLCKEIAALHGTDLHFESEKGKGTTVSFTLRKGGDRDD